MSHNYVLDNEPVNNNPVALKVKISNLIKNGRKEITTKDELEEYPIGALISYITKKGIFRSGGFIDKFEDKSFIYLSAIDFKTRVRVKYSSIQKMWAGDVYKTKNDTVSIIPSTNKQSKYFVKIGDVVVYYAPDSTMITRFKCTKKYDRMIKWHERYGDVE